MMYKECRHIKPNGLRCKSPALRGGHFCYYHSKIHTVSAGPDAQFAPLQLPTPEDPAAIQLSVARISDAVINGRLDIKKAANLFFGLKIAAQFIDAKAYFHEPATVQSAEQGSQGDELAPEEYVCDDDDDCNDCPYFGACSRCVSAGDDDAGDNSDEEDDDEEDDDDDDEDEDDEDEDDDE